MFWNIRREANGEFKLWADTDPERPLHARDESELGQQLRGNGATDTINQDVLRQLGVSDLARVEMTVGQFSQI
jgi:hypothetical protein